MKLTLDWNCVIEVEEKRPQSHFVLDLVRRHRDREFDVALLAASASENTRSKRFPGSADLFKDRILALGWQDLPIVPMPGVIGLSYFDYSYWIGDADKFECDMKAIWQVIAPNEPREPSDYFHYAHEITDADMQSEVLSKWRNTWCDVMSAYTHITEGRDVFVTNNKKDFQRNTHRLSELGMKNITTPADALNVVLTLLGN